MDFKTAAIAVLVVLVAGCVSNQAGPECPACQCPGSAEWKMFPGQEPLHQVVDETLLQEKYGCEQTRLWGAVATSTGNYTVYECLSGGAVQSEYPPVATIGGKNETGIFVQNAAGSSSLGTYLFIKGDEVVHVKTPDQVATYFAPITTPYQAFNYVIMTKGLVSVSRLDERLLPYLKDVLTPQYDASPERSEQRGDAWLVTVMYKHRDACPCYGTYYQGSYNVTRDGLIGELYDNPRVAFKYETDCAC